MSSDFQLREPQPSPRRYKRQRCHFCPGVRLLTPEEEHASDLVGTLPRCALHLEGVGIKVEPKAKE